ncbi:hypothetical protein [Azospirillum sp.]|uniref:hypothetical protein n=1 Tax=Azospirillum sp. TaxID=34012 RepID=UPI003D717286
MFGKLTGNGPDLGVARSARPAGRLNGAERLYQIPIDSTVPDLLKPAQEELP